MSFKKSYFSGKVTSEWDVNRNPFQRHFWWPFKKKKKSQSKVRPGAMAPEQVKRRIEELGTGKQIEIIRIGYDGEIDDMPINVEILDIGANGFTGRIVNVERHMIESSTEKLVYAKQGGGIIEFSYNDGDISEIIMPRDAELLQEERNVEALQEILAALEQGDHIIVAYYDAKERGTLNAEGVITEKTDDKSSFSMQIEKINRIELEKKIQKKFNVEKDLVVDIEMV